MKRLLFGLLAASAILRVAASEGEWLTDLPKALDKAKAEKKLVFMIHLSGNFEDKEFT